MGIAVTVYMIGIITAHAIGHIKREIAGGEGEVAHQ